MDVANGTGIRVLTAGNDPLLTEETRRLVRENGGTVHSAQTQTEALEAIQSGACDLLVLDLDAPAFVASELVDSARRHAVAGIGPHVVALIGPAGEPPSGSRFSAAWTRSELDREFHKICGAFGFHRASALTNAGDDPDLLRELIVIFLDECPRILDDLRQGLTSGDFHKVEMAAHKLKGGVGNFGAPGAVTAALELEDAAGRNDGRGSRDALLRLELVMLHLTRTLGALA